MTSLIALAAAALAAPVQAAAPPPAPLPSDPLPADWRAIPGDEVMIVTLATGKQVVIRLAPGHAPAHVANIRALARAKWWDGTSVYRVQENWVTQWGDATEKKPLPAGITDRPAAEFEIAAFQPAVRMRRADSYSTASGITADGWPVATDGKAAWLTHCYGMVGVARDDLPSTGSGAELFTPIGQSARRLDRNYTVVGRIVEGMQYLSGLPRSDAAMGMYDKESERVPIVSVRLASDLPAADRPHFQYRAADNIRFAAAVARRENPPPPLVSLGGAAVCDVLPAVRRAP
ncbi:MULTISPECIES: peptidylprolyl isomerase [unclassified Sphingomonas]|jgi:cyclophilin family peptidyl-prolyl cis-trans isomerase|uniref:peptidylprolyl isomerase n=1 Tax=unclassified Sphingomonas TaxID=196159 RepID=UPI000E107729|nr:MULTISPECIES: peptidylprolyl isomerase [unclassified Sphingomonas]AXJ94881.1 peptidylprolyl isomerase [Sphingomonas sp. FARSPH]